MHKHTDRSEKNLELDQSNESNSTNQKVISELYKLSDIYLACQDLSSYIVEKSEFDPLRSNIQNTICYVTDRARHRIVALNSSKSS
jgi:hypothetical protein